MPPIKCTPCRVIYEGVIYRVQSNGVVYSLTDGEQLPEFMAKLVRREGSCQRRNRNARKRNQAMRDLGMKKTPYGWE